MPKSLEADALARRFNMVSPALWRSKRWIALDGDARQVGLHALTCEQVTSAGCYRLLPGYACADLGGWELSRYGAAISTLEQAGILSADHATAEVLIERWFKHCPPTNSKHFEGTSKLVALIESERLRQQAAEALNAAWADVQSAQAQKAAARAADGVVPLSGALRSKMRSRE